MLWNTHNVARHRPGASLPEALVAARVLAPSFRCAEAVSKAVDGCSAVDSAAFRLPGTR
jgi:hypothetical protein